MTSAKRVEDQVTGLELIVTALAAGASAGVSNTAAQAVQESYGQLKKLLRQALHGRGDSAEALAALDAEQVEPGVWQTTLGDPLVASEADQDPKVLKAAEEVLAVAAKYHVEVRDSRGVQVGDHNQQTNHFG